MFVYLLIGVLMSGQMVLIDVLPTRLMCNQAKQYIDAKGDRPANVFCVETLLREI